MFDRYEAVHRILATTDFSECSAEALRYAVFMARHFEARLDVLHVGWEPSPYVGLGILLDEAPGDRRTVEQVVFDKASAELNAFLGRVFTELPSSLSAQVKLGKADQVIVQHAKEQRHDLIVLGTHGRSAVSRLVLGSIAEKIVRAAPCPVIAVPMSTTGPASKRAEARS